MHEDGGLWFTGGSVDRHQGSLVKAPPDSAESPSMYAVGDLWYMGWNALSTGRPHIMSS